MLDNETTATFAEFGGEEYLTMALPNYANECWFLSMKLLAACFFTLVVVPFVLATLVNGASFNPAKITKLQKTPSKNNTTQKRSRLKAVATDAEEGGTINTFIAAVASMGCLAAVCSILLNDSPYNYFASRGVFQVPLLTSDECHHILEMANLAADHNYQTALEVDSSMRNKSVGGLLQEPHGWQKTRHGHYQTTDLNIVTDPFDLDDLKWLEDKLDARLAPTLARIFGVPVASLRANDMFVVRYDADYRTKLDKHTDEADISFSILLNDDFEGGGTRFWDRTTETPFAHMEPREMGQLVTHSANIDHEGVPITKSSRVILVGFMSVDNMDPFTGKRTGLGKFASWLSLPWMNTKFREASSSADYRVEHGIEKWSNNKYVRALFRDMANLLEELGDFFCPHHSQVLVLQKNAEQYLDALDQAHMQVNGNHSEASWFRGQQVHLDIDGKINHEFITRTRSQSRFSVV